MEEKVFADKKKKNIVRENSKTKDLVLTGLLVALVFVATRFINIRLPIQSNGGLIHLGNTMLFMIAIVFGSKKAAVAGAFGMGLFDVLSGWAVWAPFTFIIRGVMGYLIGTISQAGGKKGNSFTRNLIAITVGGIWMLLGYYIAEVILYGNWIVPFGSIPGDIVQVVLGAMIGLPMAAALKKSKVV
ncbi:ECF transporter S component [Clostridium formicaceticum]|uniref:ECF transporter S component n=1 Tax=Clostridium formicaceticum TaxID=1497 RepID=UPI001F29EDE0|nr:ECF transporter S component [Clostridium formicaceticum]